MLVIFAISIAIQIVLGLLFIGLGIFSFLGGASIKKKFSHLQVPSYFRFLTGLVQLIGGSCMLIGVWYSPIAIAGGLWLFITMTTALLLRLKVKDSIRSVMPAAAIGISSVAVFVIHIC